MTEEAAVQKPGPPPSGLRVKVELDGWVLGGGEAGPRQTLVLAVVVMVGIGLLSAAGAAFFSASSAGGIGLTTVFPPALVVILIVAALIFIATRQRAGEHPQEIRLRAANLSVRRSKDDVEVIGWDRIGPAEVTHRKEADAMGMELDKGRTVRLRWAQDGRPFAATHARTDWEVLTLGQGLGHAEAAWLEAAVAWLQSQDADHRLNADLDDLIGGGHQARAREAIEALRDERGPE